VSARFGRDDGGYQQVPPVPAHGQRGRVGALALVGTASIMVAFLAGY
jgi:hypothetical protein